MKQQLSHGGRPQIHGLVLVRALFLNFVGALVLIGLVVAVLEPANAGPDAVLAGAVLVVLGACCLFLSSNRNRPLHCGDAVAIARQFRERFFMRIAFVEVPALLGFVGVFVAADAVWLYPLGAAFSAIGFALLAPTKARVAVDQAALDASGCDQSVVASLAELPPS